MSVNCFVSWNIYIYISLTLTKINIMNEKIAKILCKIENHLDNLQDSGHIECHIKVDIQFMLDEINELI